MNPNSPNSPDRPQGASGGMLRPETEQRLKSDVDAAIETAKDAFGALKSTAEAEAGGLMAEGKEQLDEAVEKAKGLAAEQKDLLSEQLTGVAQAVSKVAGELEAENASTAGYARTIAQGVDRFARTIKDRDVDDLLHLAEDFGRKQPGAFMAAAAIAGFAASRFLVASAKRREGEFPTQYGANSKGGYAARTYAGAAVDSGSPGGIPSVRQGGVPSNATATARGSEEGLAAEGRSGQGGTSNTNRLSPRSTGRDPMGGSV